MRKLTSVIVICILIFSCHKNSLLTLKSNKCLFQPNFIITPSYILLTDELKRVPVDVPIYHYNIGDTSIYFELSHDSSSLVSQYWEFHIGLRKSDSIELSSFLKKNDMTILTEKWNMASLMDNRTVLYSHQNNTIYSIHFTFSYEFNDTLVILQYFFPVELQN